MALSKKEAFTKADFLTVTKFAIKYGINKNERGLVQDAFSTLFKKNKQARTNSGIITPVIISDRHAHDITSRYRAHPLFHDIVLNEIEKQRVFAAGKAKGAAK